MRVPFQNYKSCRYVVAILHRVASAPVWRNLAFVLEKTHLAYLRQKLEVRVHVTELSGPDICLQSIDRSLVRRRLNHIPFVWEFTPAWVGISGICY